MAESRRQLRQPAIEPGERAAIVAVVAILAQAPEQGGEFERRRGHQPAFACDGQLRGRETEDLGEPLGAHLPAGDLRAQPMGGVDHQRNACRLGKRFEPDDVARAAERMTGQNGRGARREGSGDVGRIHRPTVGVRLDEHRLEACPLDGGRPGEKCEARHDHLAPPWIPLHVAESLEAEGEADCATGDGDDVGGTGEVPGSSLEPDERFALREHAARKHLAKHRLDVVEGGQVGPHERNAPARRDRLRSGGDAVRRVHEAETFAGLAG